MARVEGTGGWAASGIKSIAEGPDGRCGMVTTECAALGGEWMAGAMIWGWMMWRIRNQEGSKPADEIRREPGGRNLRTGRFT